MAQWKGALAVLTKASVPRTHMEPLTTLVTLAQLQGESYALFWPPQALHTGSVYTDKQIRHMHIN